MGRPLPPSKAAIVMAIAAFFAVIFFGIVKTHSQEIPAVQEPSTSCPGATIDDMARHMEGWQQRGLGAFRILDQSETAEFLAAYNSVPPVSDYAASFIVIFFARQAMQAPGSPLIAPGGGFMALYDDDRCATVGGVLSPNVLSKTVEQIAKGRI
jgi:hypothetical protein